MMRRLSVGPRGQPGHMKSTGMLTRSQCGFGRRHVILAFVNFCLFFLLKYFYSIPMLKIPQTELCSCSSKIICIQFMVEKPRPKFSETVLVIQLDYSLDRFLHW